MSLSVLYLGQEPWVIQNSYSRITDSQPKEMYATSDPETAINRLIQLEFDCLLLDSTMASENLLEMLQTIRVLDDEMYIVYRHVGSESFLPDTLDNLIDEVITEERCVEQLAESLSAVKTTDKTPPIDLHRSGTYDIRESVNERVAHVQLGGSYIWCGSALADRLTIMEENPVGEGHVMTYPGDSDEGLLELGQKAVELGTSYRRIVAVRGRYYQYQVFPATEESYLIIERGLGTLKDSVKSKQSINAFVEVLLDQIDDVFFVSTFDNEIVHWNRKVSEVTGYSDEELSELRAIDLFPTDRQEDALQQLDRVRKNGEAAAELEFQTRDGDVIPYQFSGSLIRSVDGKPLYACGIGRDISKQREIGENLERTIRMLERSNEELEQFAYVASHDLKEPLRMIRSYLNLLNARYNDQLDADGKDFLNFAVDGADRLQSMIDDLLTYSRVGVDTSVEAVDCNEVFADVIGNLSLSIDEAEASVTADDLPTVNGDRNLILQLFQNLLINAVQHGGKGVSVHMSAESQGERWCFSVEDDGVGMTPEEQVGIFDLFSSGYNESGIGIGLTTCKKIVTQYGGEIWVESQKGVKTTFYFTLPSTNMQVDVVNESKAILAHRS